MASKPRKQFDGIGRPQGFIDDAAKAAVNAVRKVAGRPYYMYLKDETTGKAAKEFGRIKVSGGKTIKKPSTPKNTFMQQAPKPKQKKLPYGPNSSRSFAETTRMADKYFKQPRMGKK